MKIDKVAQTVMAMRSSPFGTVATSDQMYPLTGPHFSHGHMGTPMRRAAGDVKKCSYN